MQKFPTSFGSAPQNLVGDIFNKLSVSCSESVSPSNIGYWTLIFGIFIVAIVLYVKPSAVFSVFVLLTVVFLDDELLLSVSTVCESSRTAINTLFLAIVVSSCSSALNPSNICLDALHFCFYHKKHKCIEILKCTLKKQIKRNQIYRFSFFFSILVLYIVFLLLIFDSSFSPYFLFLYIIT